MPLSKKGLQALIREETRKAIENIDFQGQEGIDKAATIAAIDYGVTCGAVAVQKKWQASAMVNAAWDQERRRKLWTS